MFTTIVSYAAFIITTFLIVVNFFRCCTPSELQRVLDKYKGVERSMFTIELLIIYMIWFASGAYLFG